MSTITQTNVRTFLMRDSDRKLYFRVKVSTRETGVKIVDGEPLHSLGCHIVEVAIEPDPMYCSENPLPSLSMDEFTVSFDFPTTRDDTIARELSERNGFDFRPFAPNSESN